MRILALSAHADDADGAAGGTLARLLEDRDNEVFYLALSIAEESVPEGFSRDAVFHECKESTSKLGIPAKNVAIERYPVRRLPENRQEILDLFIRFRRDVEPDLVILPSSHDIHQDHVVVFHEGVRAFRRCSSIYGYDFPWNILYTSNLNVFYELGQRHLQKKIDSLSCYRSQMEKANNCFTGEYITSLAIERGNRIGKRYAEAFEMIREVRRL